MIIHQQLVIQAPTERVWEFTMHLPGIARCVPGFEAIDQIDEDTYVGAVRAHVGPVAVRLSGKVWVAERNRDALLARMNLEAADRRIRGAVNAKLSMRLESGGDGTTAMAVHTDAAILGKLGELGQAVVRRKASQIMEQFARNLSTELGAPGAPRRPALA
jgi:carbon monoxide dehydrogenase subunit G